MGKRFRFFSLFFVTVVATVLWGCKEVIIESPQFVVDSSILETKSNDSFNSDDVLFHNYTGSWIVPLPDPYKLDFINAVLAENNTLKSMLDSNVEQLDYTHFALKVFPRDLEEIQYFEGIEGVKISYIPFSYRKISSSLVLSDGIGVEERRVVQDEVKYKISCTLFDGDGNPTCTTEENMPVLYVVWPASKPLPEQFDYEIDYEVFIPTASPLYDDNISLFSSLERAAIDKAFSTQNDISFSRGVRLYSGYVYHLEPWLELDIPLEQLKIRFQLGSNITDVYTDSNGYFSVTIDSASTAEVVFQNPRWKIITTTSNNPQTFSLSCLNSSWINGNTIYLNNDLAVTHIALHTYYYFSHGVPIEYNDDPIRIRLITSYSGHSGEFHPGLLGSSCVDIYYGIYHEKDLISLVCHELGHYTHYLVRNGFVPYTSVHRLFKESYANYSGWYITTTFYKHLDPTLGGDTLYTMFSRHNQNWTQNDTGDSSHYSPLFVDLIDSRNQRFYPTLNTDYNNDVISGIPHSVIRQMITKRIWSDIKAVLNNYTGIYFSSADFNSFVAPYDFYFTHD